MCSADASHILWLEIGKKEIMIHILLYKNLHRPKKIYTDISVGSVTNIRYGWGRLMLLSNVCKSAGKLWPAFLFLPPLMLLPNVSAGELCR